MFNYTCEINTIIRILIVHPADFHVAGLLADFICRCIHALVQSALSSLFSGNAYITSLDTAWGRAHYSFDTHIPTLCLSYFIPYFPSILPSLLKHSTVFATNTNIYEIVEARVFAEQPAPNCSVYTIISRCTNLPPCLITLLRATNRPVVGKLVSWCCSSLWWSLLSGMRAYSLRVRRLKAQHLLGFSQKQNCYQGAVIQRTVQPALYRACSCCNQRS